MATTELYRDEDILVRARTGFSDAVCFVTFDSLTHYRTLDRLGFGENFFAFHKIDAVHVVQRTNRWYQDAGLPIACRHIASLTSTYPRVIAYGSSMGGYAAIRFGRWTGAHEAFALSPQFSASPFRRPFDLRWFHERGGLRMLHERTLEPVATATVAYDPLEGIEARHVDRFRRHTRIVDVRVPGGGHPVTGFLSNLGLLQKCLFALASDDFVAGHVEREVLQRREESSQYHIMLALKEPSKEKAIAHAMRSVEIDADFAPAWACLAETAGRGGRFDQAEAAIERAKTLEPGYPAFRAIEARALERAGAIDEAVALTRELMTISASYGRRLPILRGKKAIAFVRAKLRRAKST